MVNHGSPSNELSRASEFNQKKTMFNHVSQQNDFELASDNQKSIANHLSPSK
jgi:hypothetical protein